MDYSGSENAASSEVEMEAMLQEMLQVQIALDKNVSSTSQFLRFVLNLALLEYEIKRVEKYLQVNGESAVLRERLAQREDLLETCLAPGTPVGD